MQTAPDIAAILTSNAIRTDRGSIPENIHFELESLEALNVSEETHFWPLIRQTLVTSLIGRYTKTPCSFLDVGCGNGGLLRHVEKTFPGSTVAGMDGYLEALVNCRRRNSSSHLFLQDITKSPWMETGESYDVISFMDVLEHLDHPEIALHETAKILKKDGVIIVSLPARHELWSKRDTFLGHRLRYDYRDLRTLMEKSGYEILHMNYLFSYLYIPMWINRQVIAPIFRIPDDQVEQNEFRIVPLLNRIVTWIGKLEVMFAAILPVPLGTSLYCVARRKA